ncbi:MAG: thioredoxin-disulfide reductase [Clostridia bacterium]|nr:thioredoxin-disulfide reductase [Clostridia bacterium]
MSVYDIVIIGGGPAGITAGIYGSRAALKVLLIESAMPGGLAATTDLIENYPGFPEGLNGSELSANMLNQAERFGLQMQYGAVYSLKKEDNLFYLTTDEGEVQAKSVILATGAKPRMSGCPGEKEYYGRGVSYCATCDGAFFRDKVVVVVGGGDSAVEEAGYLTKFASKVYLVHRRNELRAAKIVQQRAKANPKLEFKLSKVVEAIQGDQFVQSVILKDVESGDLETLEAQGVFMYIGYNPSTDLVKDLVELDPKGYIITDAEMKTALPGLFAAGDVRQKLLRQVVTATADGAIAAVAAEKYLENIF